jgi:hypothetical protein
MSRRRPIINDTLARLATAEEAFLRQEFIAPALRGGTVQVKIAAVRCELWVEPGDFEGFGIFRPRSHALAQLVRPATLAERRRYLRLFPRIDLVLVRREKGHWWAAAAQGGDARVRIEGLVPVRLVEEAERFDQIAARFDGAQFWFDDLDDRRDPANARYLRESLGKMTPPADLQRPGIAGGQRAAYESLYGARKQQLEQDEQARAENRLRNALAHAGAHLRDYGETGDSYRLSYTVDGQPHTSVVRKRDLTVTTAGICLSGQDQDFDLASLVGVLREGATRWD